MAKLHESAERHGAAAQNGKPVAPALLEASYNHHVRGRLRARFDRLIGDSPAMDAAERRLAAVHGVLAVSGNLLLGSVILRYDPRILPPAEVPEVLASHGFALARPADPAPGSPGLTALAETALAAASRSLFEVLVHRAVRAVIAG